MRATGNAAYAWVKSGLGGTCSLALRVAIAAALFSLKIFVSALIRIFSSHVELTFCDLREPARSPASFHCLPEACDISNRMSSSDPDQWVCFEQSCVTVSLHAS